MARGGSAAFKFKMEGDIEAFVRFTDPTLFRKNLEVEIKKGTRRAALVVIREIKKRMRKGEYDKNATLTLALSKGTIPTIKEKNLADAITHKLLSSFKAEVGIIRNSESTGSAIGFNKSTIKMQRLVTLMETGYTIKVTPKMVYSIFAAIRNRLNEDAGEHLEARGKKYWRVPPRRIFSEVLKDSAVDKMVQAEWRKALESTFKKMGAKDGDWKDK